MRLANSNYAGYFFALAAAASWSVIGIFTRVPIGHDISPLEVAFWRGVIGSLCFLAHGIINGAWRVRPLDGLIFAAFGVTNIALFFLIYGMAIQHGGAAQASILLYTAPLWVVVAARLLFKERLTWHKAIALLAASSGVTLLCLAGGGLPQGTDLAGVLCGLAAGFLYAMHFLFGKIYLKRVSAISIYMYAILFGTLLLFPFVEFAPHKTWPDWTAMIGLGLICTYLAYQFYCAALKRLPAGKVAVLCNLEPMLAVLLAVLIWNESFSGPGWLGIALVIGSVFLVMLDKKG